MSFRSSGGGGGGQGISRGNFSAPRGNFQTGGQSAGNFHARGEFKNFQSRGEFKRGDGDFRARGQVQTRELKSRDIQSGDFKRGFKGDGFKGDGDRRADYSRWKGNRPHLVHRGWDRHHKHRFFGAFLIGVPFGYAAVSTHPCYDWIYGPQGWGYYWNYDRCPV